MQWTTVASTCPPLRDTAVLLSENHDTKESQLSWEIQIKVCVEKPLLQVSVLITSAVISQIYDAHPSNDPNNDDDVLNGWEWEFLGSATTQK